MSPLPHFKDSYSQKSKGIFSIEHVFKFTLSLRKTKMKLFLRMLSSLKLICLRSKKISSEAILLKGKKQTIAVCCLHYCCHAGAHPILQSIDVLYIHYSTRNSIVRHIFFFQEYTKKSVLYTTSSKKIAQCYIGLIFAC